MSSSYICRTLAVAVIIAGSLTLAGCGKSMSGTYANDMMEIEFNSGGTAYVTSGIEGLNRTTAEARYKVEGNKIIIRNQAGSLVLTRNEDDSLSGAPMEAMSGPLRRKSVSSGGATGKGVTGNELSGKYVTPDRGITIEFKSGKAYATVDNETRECRYEANGNRITVMDPDGKEEPMKLVRVGDRLVIEGTDGFLIKQ